MEGRFDISKEALQLAHEAEVKHVALSLAVIVAYIMKFIQLVRNEILAGKKRNIAVTNEELYDKIVDDVTATKEDCADASTELFLLAEYRTVRNALWRYVTSEEGANICAKLKTDAKFAYHFFYDTDEKGCNISSLRRNIQYKIRSTYHINISCREISSIVYTKLWSDGTWAILDSFSGNGSFFSWLSKVAMNAVIADLEEQHLIRTNRSKTGSNTRLKLKSKPPEYCRFLIEELLPDSKNREILLAVYADRLSEHDIEQKFNLTRELYQKAFATAELALKEALIDSDLLFVDEVVHDKKLQISMVSTDFAAGFMDWLSNQEDDDPFKDVFGINMNEEERAESVIKVINAICNSVDWSDKDRYVWEQRYLCNVSPEKLAHEMGQQRTWVDNRYSRARKKFNEAAREWWKNKSGYNNIKLQGYDTQYR